jgi:membrane protein
MPARRQPAAADRPRGASSLLSGLGAIAAYKILDALLSGDDSAANAREASTAGSKAARARVHLKRAAEAGRGRSAAGPAEIPWRGWKDVLWRAYLQIQEDRLLAIAAGVVFYALLALFPALTAFVSLYGLFADPSTVRDQLAFLSTVMPAAAVGLVGEQVERLVSKANAELGLRFALGLAIALWSANAGIKAIIDALNVVYEEDEKRGFFRLNLVSLAFTVAALAALLVAVAVIVAVPVILNWVGLGRGTSALLDLGRWPVLGLCVLVGLAVLYRFAPSRKQPKWQWVSVGSVVAAILWIVGSALFSYYLENFANYDATYGSLGAAIGMMMWMWMTTIVVLFGAELNSEIEHQTAVDSTEGEPKPLGERGATMADTVGAAQS